MAKYLGSKFLADVLADTLTGLSTATSTVITAADSILGALGKLQAQLTTEVSRATTAEALLAPKANPSFTGAISNTTASGGVELGSTSAPNTPFVDFHSSGNNIDYDARIIASGGSASIGQGALQLVTGPSGVTGDFSAGSVKAASATALRSLAARFGEFANVLDFGADSTGVADSAAAFSAAFAANGAVYAPAGTYKISSTVIINRTACALRGAGPGLTVLMNNSTTASTIVISSTVAAAFAWVSDLTLDRSVTPTSTARGIMTEPGNFTCGQVNLFNIISQHNWEGFYLGNVAFGIADRCVAQFNWSNGFTVSNGTWNPACQWTLLNCLAQFNDGAGYYVGTVVPTQNLPSPTWSTTNPAYVTLNTWFYCTTFANKTAGVELHGSATAPLCDFSLHGGWIGSDGGHGLFGDTYGINNRVVNTVFELSSTYGTATTGGGIGRTQNVAAPKQGMAINLSVNNQDWSIIGGLINQPAWHGIGTLAQNTQIVGMRIFDCGLATPSTYAGVSAGQGHGGLIVNGCVITNPSGGGGFQAYGVSVYDGSLVVVTNNDLRFNPVKGFLAGTNAQLANVSGNLGYISRNSGSASIPAGAGFWFFPHGLVVTPTIVQITPAGGGISNVYVASVDATNIAVQFTPSVPANTFLYWSAAISAYA